MSSSSFSSSSSASSESSFCSPLEFDPHGRVGIAVAQPQSGVDYPLVTPSEDIRFLLADAYFSYDDPADYDSALAPFVPPLRIRWLFGFGCLPAVAPSGEPAPVHDADVVLIDDDGDVVFDSTTATEFLSKPWGDRLHIFAWETADAVLRLVMHTKWPPADAPEARDYPIHLSPEHAVLDEFTVERRPKRVKSFTVVLDNMAGVPVDFVEGFNVAFAASTISTPGGRLVNRIQMEAVPGFGAGIFPGCGPEPLVIRTMNGVPPTVPGDFQLSATDCYFVRQPTTLVSTLPRLTVPTPAMLQIGGDCTPCCACEDYVAAAEYLNETAADYTNIGQIANGTRNLYHQNRTRWTIHAECLEKLKLRLVLVPQLCPFLDVAAQFCNQSEECITTLKLTINFAGTPVSAAEVAGFTVIRGLDALDGRRGRGLSRYTMGGSWPVFTATWDSVEPFSAVHVRFRLEFDDCGEFSGGPVGVKASLSGTADGVPVATSISRDAVLECPPGPDDVQAPLECI